MREKVEGALREIRPSLQADGGDVELVDVENGIVKVRLTGACGGCPMSQITLKQGIEQHIKKVIPECHPDHPQPGSEEYGVTFPRSICLPHLSTMRNPLSMTMPARGVIKVEVLYTNATLTLAGIEEKIRKATEEALGDNRFSINREPRTTDFLKPWIERPDHPLVQSGLHHLRDITGDEVELAYGKPTANENVIANWGMPVITLPPDAEGEHSANERVRVSYVDEVMVPWILAMAGSERSHTHWQK